MKWNKVGKVIAAKGGEIWQMTDDYFLVEVYPLDNNQWGITILSFEDEDDGIIEDKIEIRKIATLRTARLLAESLVVALRWGHHPFRD